MIFKTLLIFLITSSPILAGSTDTQKSIPAKVDSQQVMLLSQQIGSLLKKIESIDTLLQKQAMQTVSTPKKENWWKENAGWIKDWANVLFFFAAIIGTGATLWYNRKTLFSPLRTEVFKKQFEIYCDILNIIDNPKIYTYEDLILLNLLTFMNRYENFKMEVTKSNEYFSKLLSERFETLEICDRALISVAEELRSASDTYTSKEYNGKFKLLRIKIDHNTLSVWETLQTKSGSTFVATKIKEQVQTLIDSIKERIIKENFVPKIEKYINELYEWINDNIDENKKNDIETSSISTESLAIYSYFTDIRREFCGLDINSKEQIKALREEICRQLKLHEILKKPEIKIISNIKSFIRPFIIYLKT